MILDYQCVTEEAVASSRPMKARQYVTPETLTHRGQSWHGPASRTDASRHPVSRPAISVVAVTRCSEYEKKVSLCVKKKMDNDLHDNTE